MDSNDVCKLPKSKFKEGDKVRLTFKITGFDSKKILTIKDVEFIKVDESCCELLSNCIFEELVTPHEPFQLVIMQL